ncbi:MULTISPECIES: hypothetical protein [Paenibacillus]|uniref:hypothetical protein n=1 Tax=Paenibacillus TaxID=44249 RepID=UPI002FE19EDB
MNVDEKVNNVFLETKKKYNSLREDERKKIIRYLSERGFTATNRGGNGRPDYTNHRQLEKSYDLTNWKYIEATKGDIKYFISLQAFDRDIKTTNYHVLMDRIGICAFSKEVKKPDYFSLMQVTSLELPFGEKELDELLEIMNNINIIN